MDAGASVAAFIGLVALVARSTTSLIRLVKDIRNTPGAHQSNLKWLEQLSCVLKELQNTGSILQQAKLTVDLSTTEEYLRSCHEAIDVLRAHLWKKPEWSKEYWIRKRKANLKAVATSGFYVILPRQLIALIPTFLSVLALSTPISTPPYLEAFYYI